MTFYHHIVMLPPEESEGARSLPRYPALVAMAPTIPRELQAEDGWFAAFDLAGLSGFGTPTLLLLLLLLGGDSPATQKAAARLLRRRCPTAVSSCCRGRDTSSIERRRNCSCARSCSC